MRLLFLCPVVYCGIIIHQTRTTSPGIRHLFTPSCLSLGAYFPLDDEDAGEACGEDVDEDGDEGVGKGVGEVDQDGSESSGKDGWTMEFLSWLGGFDYGLKDKLTDIDD